MTLGKADLSIWSRLIRFAPIAAILALALTAAGAAPATPPQASKEKTAAPSRAASAQKPAAPAKAKAAPVKAKAKAQDEQAAAEEREREEEAEREREEAEEREGEKSEGDADVPRFIKGKIDKLEYMLGRSGWIAAMRGLDTAQPGSRAKATREMEQQERAAGLRNPNAPVSNVLNPTTWTFVGPNPIPNGQTSTFSAAVSGRVSTVAVDPTDENVVWAGAAGGGVYRSLDGGASWTPVLDSAITMAIGAIAIAPSDPTIVYVGTGEAGGSADSFMGDGLYRITDAKSATPVVEGPFNQDAVAADVFYGRSVSKILVHPTDPATIFVSTASGVGGNPGSQTGFVFPNRGFWRSTNATAASPVFAKLSVATAPGNFPYYDAVMEPGNPDNVLVTINAAGVDGGVWRTTNALAADPTTVVFTRTLALASVRAELAINKVGATVTVVVASGETTPIGARCTAAVQGGVRISTDGGVTWSAAPLQSAGGFCSAQCFYDIFVAMDPGDASKIYLGGSADSSSANPCRPSVSMRSTDAGATFTRNSSGLHADSHAVAVAPTNTNVVYTGNDGGMFKSVDAGVTWTSLNNTFISATQFQSIAVHPRHPKFTIGGTQDNGTNGMDGSGTWNRVDFGDGGYALIDQTSYDTSANRTMYHTYFNQANNIIGFARVLPGETAQENGWTFLGFNGVPNGIVNQNVMFYAPIALGPGTPNTLYFGGDRLYRSTNRGTTMVQVSQNPVVAAHLVSTIAIAPQDDNFRLIGLNANGRIFGTTTGANPLVDLTPPLVPLRPVNRVIFDPNDKNVAYATLGGFVVPAGQHVWKNTNVSGGAANWVPSGAGIPDVPVNSIVVDPQDSNRVYVATDIGVYVSVDGGASWLPAGSGLPRVAVFDIAIQNQSRTLRIATHGRGMWELEIPGAMIPESMLSFVSSSSAITSGNGNPYLEPDEDASLTITLGNAVGASGTPTAMTATITTSTPGITILNGTSAYTNLSPGTTGANLVPLTFHVDSSAVCGAVITFTVTVNYTGDSHSPRVYTVKVPTGGPSGTTTDTPYAGAPVAIPDSPAPAVTATQAVSGILGVISKVTFSFDGTSCNTTPASPTVGLDHTYVGDLAINLTSPGGTTIRLTTVGANSGVNFCNTLFDDAAATAWISATAAAAPFTGSYRPVDALSAFAGEDPNGTWTVTMQDGGGGDVGTLRAFTVRVTPAVCAGAFTAPTVTTPTSASVTATGATLGGDVTSDGGSTITERGVVHSQTGTNNDPVIGGTGVTKTVAAGTTGVFTTPVTGLSPATGHSFKAFATNAIGTSYTSVASFNTPCPVITLGSLPNGNLTVLYTGSATAAGGTGPYTYAVTSGTLPGGLSLTSSGAGAGDVSGTPTTTGTFPFDITATDTSGAGTCTGVQSYSVVIGPEPGQDFFTLTPCRVLDTRLAAGPLGGPALVALADRTFVVAGACGIPADAKAISVNLAVTGPTNPGNLRLHPGGTAVPLVSSINFKAGQTRSNNAVVPLSALGALAAYLDQTAGTAHLILDVNGYFK